jgi:hypothetical protein
VAPEANRVHEEAVHIGDDGNPIPVCYRDTSEPYTGLMNRAFHTPDIKRHPPRATHLCTPLVHVCHAPVAQGK